jgi:hypothetical protein
LLHLARIPDSSSTLPTLRRMPFPGPAKEQRANTSHNFRWVMMRRRVNERKGFENKRANLFLRSNCTDQSCARDIRIWIKSSQRERNKRKHRPCRPETTWTDGRRNSFPPNASKGAFYSKFSARSVFPSFLSMEQGMDEVCCMRVNGRGKETAGR